MHDSIQVGNEIVEFGEFGGTSVKSRLCLLARKKRQPFKYSVYIITTIFESIEFKKNFK